MLFVNNSGVHNVELGTVIRVRCTASSSSAPTMTWFKDGSSLTNDPPHVRIRTSTDGTAVVSTLTIDNFDSTDDGDYFCQASDDTNSESSTTLSLTSKLFTQYSTVYLISRYINADFPYNVCLCKVSG